jgi:hypothetical protein
MPDVMDIVSAWLRANGYDGLCIDGPEKENENAASTRPGWLETCFCKVDEGLCKSLNRRCEPGHLKPATAEEAKTWCVGEGSDIIRKAKDDDCPNSECAYYDTDAAENCLAPNYERAKAVRCERPRSYIR